MSSQSELEEVYLHWLVPATDFTLGTEFFVIEASGTSVSRAIHDVQIYCHGTQAVFHGVFYVIDTDNRKTNGAVNHAVRHQDSSFFCLIRCRRYPQEILEISHIQ